MQIPVVANVNAEYILDKTIVKKLLIRQVSNSVLFEASIKNMLKNGVDTFVEIGPGKVLSGFVRKISREVRVLNVEDVDSLNKTLCELKSS